MATRRRDGSPVTPEERELIRAEDAVKVDAVHAAYRAELIARGVLTPAFLVEARGDAVTRAGRLRAKLVELGLLKLVAPPAGVAVARMCGHEVLEEVA